MSAGSSTHYKYIALISDQVDHSAKTGLSMPFHTFIDIFRDHAQRTPKSVAIVAGEKSVTYEELDCTSDRWARMLRERGLGFGGFAGIYLSRSADFVTAVLAILKTGAAYVPLDPEYPAERINFMAADCGMSLILTEKMLAVTFKVHGVELFMVNEAEPQKTALTKIVTRPMHPDEPMYVIYTSGSTGRPKGVVVTGRGISPLIHAQELSLRTTSQSRVLQFSSFSFDASVWEMIMALGTGGTLVLALEDDRRPDRLCELLKRERVTHATLPPGVLASIDSTEQVSIPQLIVAGENCSAELASRWCLGRQMFNAYGPTEVTICATISDPLLEGKEPPIGRAVEGTTVFVLDQNFRPVPPGCTGELYVAGEGLAQGYLKLPAQTAARFVANPYGGPGTRLYRTGDLVRVRDDGALIFVGREDQQVKLRGYRIELGEIEANLRSHPQVDDVVVVANSRAEAAQLSAFVIPRKTDQAPIDELERVLEWRELCRDTYQRVDAQARTSRFAGWISSYSGKPIPEEEMEVWLQETVSRIKRLKARRILDLGCGSGLLVRQLASESDAYTGIDFSEEALHILEKELQGNSRARHVTLKPGLVHDLAFIQDDSVDLVILNSVIQYFPGTDYLLRVLSEAVRVTRPGGHIFVGDIRNLTLLNHYHLSVELHHANNQMTVSGLAWRSREAQCKDAELVLHPLLLEQIARRWPKVGMVEIAPKTGKYDNELSRFRYEAILTLGAKQKIARSSKSMPWSKDGQWRPHLERALNGPAGTSFELLDIPDHRIARFLCAARIIRDPRNGSCTVAELKEQCAGSIGQDFNDLAAFAAERGSVIHWRSSLHPGMVDAVFNPLWESHSGDSDIDWMEYRRYANSPFQFKHSRDEARNIRDSLLTKLPEFMVPSSVEFVNSWPLTSNGKIDRALLGNRRYESRELHPPRTPEEEVLCTIFAEILGLDRVGIHDDFFTIGGDSLSAARAISKVRSVFGRDLALAGLFSSPTVAELSKAIEQTRTLMEPISRHLTSSSLPLSSAQTSLWFLDQLQNGTTEYNVPQAVRIRGALDDLVLHRALEVIAQRHEILRTRFALDNGSPIQVIDEFPQLSFDLEDLQNLNEDARKQRITEALAAEWTRPFDLGNGHLLRIRLLRFGPCDHALIRTFHHIVYDGVSQELFDRELGLVYQAFVANRTHQLAELPVQYADFAQWERASLSSTRLQRHLDYWKKQLEGIPDELDLPKDRPRGVLQSFEGDTYRICLAGSQLRTLKSLGRTDHATMFMVLLAGFAALVERYSGQQDVVVGAPVSNRHDENLKLLIGLFVNTIPMRVQVESRSGFRDLLKSVRKTVLEAYDHQRLPFDRLVEELSPARSLNRSPIFQVTFSYQPAFPTLNLGEALDVEPVLYDEYRARYDLELLAFANEETVSLWWVFNRNLFARSRIEQMANHYLTLLEGVSHNPDAPLESVEILSPEERTELLTVLNSTERAYYTDKCVHELVEEQVTRVPDAIAVTFDGERLTYSELNAAANRLALALQELSVGPETTVAICVPRSLWLAIAMLGVLKSGGAYVPLDPDYPDERHLYVLSDANVSIILTIDALRAKFRDFGVTIVSVDQPTSDNRSENIKLRRDVSLRNLAYVIYTSGSTGHPKGVMVSHRSLLNHMLWMIQELHLGTQERFLQKSAFTFDASVWEFLAPWMTGEQVVLAPANILEVTKLIQAEQITRLQFTASALRAALEEDFSACTSLQTVFCGGEMVPPALVLNFFAKSGAKFHNLYGPTETTIISTKCDIFTAAPQSAVPIGLPISNTQVYVMDQSLRITPTGVIGELYIGGDGVARGYIGKPGLTALRFIANLYGPPGTRLYRTGDMVRWNFDGQLEFIGRADTQVKIRGFRIEVEEIEHVLRKSVPVIDAAVIADLQTGLERLLAFVVLRPEQSNRHLGSDEGGSRSERPPLALEPDEHMSIIIKQLKSDLHMSLPGYMVPNSIVVLDELPKTKHGKLDRVALVKLSRVTQVTAPYASPRTELESAICRIWRDLLHVEDVSTSENFFDAGGHSLLLTKMYREVQKLTPASLLLTDLFRYPTVSSLADYLTLQESGHRETSSPDLQKLTKGRTRLRAQRATRQLVE